MPDTTPDPTVSKFEIGAEPSQLTPRFSNVVLVNQTKREIVLDFCFQLSGNTHLVSRIALTLAHAKSLHKTMGDVITKFESLRGPIALDDEKKPAQKRPIRIKRRRGS